MQPSAPPPSLSAAQEANITRILAAASRTVEGMSPQLRLDADIARLKSNLYAQELAERYAKLTDMNEREVRMLKFCLAALQRWLLLQQPV